MEAWPSVCLVSCRDKSITLYSKGTILRFSGFIKTTETLKASPSLSSIISWAPQRALSVLLGGSPHCPTTRNVHSCPWEEHDLWSQRDLVSYLGWLFTVWLWINIWTSLNPCFHVFKIRKIIHLLRLWVLNESSHTCKSPSAMSSTWSRLCLICNQFTFPIPLSSFRIKLCSQFPQFPDWSAILWFLPSFNTYRECGLYQQNDHLMTSCLGSL